MHILFNLNYKQKYKFQIHVANYVSDLSYRPDTSAIQKNLKLNFCL
jgi:hypothetical protein